jgi:hypothetical protein
VRASGNESPYALFASLLLRETSESCRLLNEAKREESPDWKIGAETAKKGLTDDESDLIHWVTLV